MWRCVTVLKAWMWGSEFFCSRIYSWRAKTNKFRELSCFCSRKQANKQVNSDEQTSIGELTRSLQIEHICSPYKVKTRLLEEFRQEKDTPSYKNHISFNRFFSMYSTFFIFHSYVFICCLLFAIICQFFFLS